jgi:hypothetical protein
MVAHCGLEQRHESRGVEVPLWMFDTAVCCQMRTASMPVVNIEALHELAALLAAQLRRDCGPMLPSTIPCYPKDVLMRVPPGPRRATQLALSQSSPGGPRWERLMQLGWRKIEVVDEERGGRLLVW